MTSNVQELSNRVDAVQTEAERITKLTVSAEQIKPTVELHDKVLRLKDEILALPPSPERDQLRASLAIAVRLLVTDVFGIKVD